MQLCRHTNYNYKPFAGSQLGVNAPFGCVTFLVLPFLSCGHINMPRQEYAIVMKDIYSLKIQYLHVFMLLEQISHQIRGSLKATSLWKYITIYSMFGATNKILSRASKNKEWTRKELVHILYAYTKDYCYDSLELLNNHHTNLAELLLGCGNFLLSPQTH